MNSAINKEDDIKETRGVGGGREVLCYNITFLLRCDGEDSVKNLGKSIPNSRTSRAQRQRGEAWHVLGTK